MQGITLLLYKNVVAYWVGKIMEMKANIKGVSDTQMADQGQC